MTSFLQVAELDENDVARIRRLENTLQSHIMAFQPGLQMADLSDAQLKEVKDVEEELGVILLAYGE